MSEKTSSSSGGIGLSTLLTVAFVVLKLTHVIDWSWWCVLAPTWGPIAGAITLLVVGFPIYLLVKKGKS